MNLQANLLRTYGESVADKEHETTEGNFIRFTTYKMDGAYYTLVMCNGDVILVGELER